MTSYEPPTVRNGSPMPDKLSEIAPGVRGYAVKVKNEIYIPLIEGDGQGRVGEFLNSLSPRCVVVNVTSDRLAGMLGRRGWIRTFAQNGVDEWRRKCDLTGQTASPPLASRSATRYNYRHDKDV